MNPLDFLYGSVEIGENEVGIVIKKVNSKSPNTTLSTHQLIALNGESGCQADTLSPGLHQGYWPWIHTILKVPVIKIPAGEIGLVIANYGSSIPPGRILGKFVECDNFQNARAFLENGGEKGRQLGILTGGTYRINTKLFTVITSVNAFDHGMNPKDLRVHTIEADRIGIVTAYDGAPIKPGEIAGSPVSGHENFQTPQKFIDGGGYRGLQEEILPSGSWNLNPWFVKVEQEGMTNIPAGTVGVIISHVGKTPKNNLGSEPVELGYKGVCKTPLYPGKHPINPRIMSVEIVPTHDVTLNWTNKQKPPTNYDAQLHALKLRSKDGFFFDIEVTQVISVAGQDAPKMISRVGSLGSEALESDPKVGRTTGFINAIKFRSIKNLVTRVLESMIDNYFRNSAQDYEALDFHANRSDRQREAIDHIKSALTAYGVQAVGTFINEIDLPDELEKILINRKIAQEQRKTYQQQILTEIERQGLVRATELAEVQQDLVRKEKGVEIAKLEAEAQIEKAKADSQTQRMMGEAEADVLREGANALGRQEYTSLRMIETAGEHQMRLVPDVAVNNSGGNGLGLVDGLIATTLRNQAIQQHLVQQSMKLESSAPSAALPQGQILCTHCETKNPSSHKFCSKCGVPLTIECNVEKT
ncbi:MAG TPA: SPFH domain-containing protein [Nostoc sp.]|uniref:SPFH domain-containing protein n=1 Tax=Nostoc sp. TaxID=1180 RepID=UPI002D243715|nr:SPFH domain-containing protein [Nostoc sp.]HYX13364.1 SPFH domain-containing protein [Nostoc sp.]